VGTPFVGEIRMFAGNFAPAGWAFCDGQLLPISENETLFNLIGTTYGGDGQATFALPDLRGRVPIHQGTGSGLSTRILAEMGGVEDVTLTPPQLPTHNHPLVAAATPAQATAEPTGSLPAIATTALYSAPASGTLAMDPAAVGALGGSEPHTNLAPFLCVNFIISLFGIFPSPN
jgi:microcystin-dependent protein